MADQPNALNATTKRIWRWENYSDGVQFTEGEIDEEQARAFEDPRYGNGTITELIARDVKSDAAIMAIVAAAERVAQDRGVEFDIEVPAEHTKSFLAWLADVGTLTVAVRAAKGGE